MMAQPSLSLGVHYRWASIPLKLSSACRKLQQCLTSLSAQLRRDIDEAGIRDVWETLAQCSKDLNELRHLAVMGLVKEEEVAQYADSWQVCFSHF